MKEDSDKTPSVSNSRDNRASPFSYLNADAPGLHLGTMRATVIKFPQTVSVRHALELMSNGSCGD